MKTRIGIGLGQHNLDPAEFASLVADIADLRFDSLWVSEVLTGAGPDPLLALAWASQLHPKVKLGTTMILPGRNHIRLAKSLATLDVMSGGRLLVTFVPGIGQGAERDAVGVPIKSRGQEIEDVMPMLRRWWAGDEIDGVTILPRPVQQPLEMWLGGLAPASLRRCGRVGDGWLGAACTPSEAIEARRIINESADACGREVDPEHFGVSMTYSHTPLDDRQVAALAARSKGRDIDPRVLVPVGLDAVRTTLKSFIDEGFSKFVIRPARAAGSWRTEMSDLHEAVGELQT
jgi:probable F420-dependent oxidoreductase